MIQATLLINYDENTPDFKDYQPISRIDFNHSKSDYSEIDKYISLEVIPQIKEKEFDMIFIKDNLSSNYLELYGLRVAYHIRLSKEVLGNKYLVPIVILSDLDGFTLNKLDSISRILFTKNIFIDPNNKESIDKYLKKEIQEFEESEFEENFLNLIKVESSENSTSHSIANEWAIYRWAKELKLSNSDSINNILEKHSYQLYFKYLKAKNNIEDPNESKKNGRKHSKPDKEFLYPFKTKPKILYIDDEWNKGWKDIFDFYFPSDLVEFKTCSNVVFLNKKYKDIKDEIVDEIFKYKPDLIILDMRLVQDDHNCQIEPENISGIKLLNKIKSTSVDTKLNPGTQVIMLSATGRSDILEQANRNNKILGYIKKDHIEDKATETNKNILKLKGFLEEGEKKFYLKEIWEIANKIYQTDLKKLIHKETKPDDLLKIKEIMFEVNSVFDILNSEIKNRFIYAMFAIVKSIEIIIKLYIYEKDKETYWCVTDELLHNNTMSTRKKIIAIFNSKLGLSDKKIHKKIHENLHNIITIRNCTIHPDGDDCEHKDTNINETHILQWFEMLQVILNRIDR